MIRILSVQLVAAAAAMLAAEPLSAKPELIAKANRLVDDVCVVLATTAQASLRAVQVGGVQVSETYAAGFAAAAARLPVHVRAEFIYLNRSVRADIRAMGLGDGCWDAVVSRLDLMAGAAVEELMQPDLLLRGFGSNTPSAPATSAPCGVALPSDMSDPLLQGIGR